MFKHKSSITRVFSKRKKMTAQEGQESEPPDPPSTSNAASTRDRNKDFAWLQEQANEKKIILLLTNCKVKLHLCESLEEKKYIFLD